MTIPVIYWLIFLENLEYGIHNHVSFSFSVFDDLVETLIGLSEPSLTFLNLASPSFGLIEWLNCIQLDNYFHWGWHLCKACDGSVLEWTSIFLSFLDLLSVRIIFFRSYAFDMVIVCRSMWFSILWLIHHLCWLSWCLVIRVAHRFCTLGT